MPGDAALAAWLRCQLDDRGWSQAELARRLGTPPQVVWLWASGGQGMAPESRAKLAAVLGVPAADIPPSPPRKPRADTAAERAALGARLRDELAARGWDQEDLAARLGVSPPAVGNWLAGRSLPSPALRKRLDALLGGGREA